MQPKVLHSVLLLLTENKFDSPISIPVFFSFFEDVVFICLYIHTVIFACYKRTLCPCQNRNKIRFAMTKLYIYIITLKAGRIQREQNKILTSMVNLQNAS